MMQQYARVKKDHPDAILLFRVGDFYETFGEDAIRAAGILDIVLTKRGNGSASEIELAGFPHHALDTYLPRLVRAGNRVAVCDQLEDPKLAKGIVKRGVTEVVTPGVAFHDQLLPPRANNFLAAVHLTRNGCGIALCDVSTGEFFAAQGTPEHIDRLLRSHRPSELLVARPMEQEARLLFGDLAPMFRLEDWVFKPEYAAGQIERALGARSLKGFGLESDPLAGIAAGAILHYLGTTQHSHIPHLQGIRRIGEAGHLWLDRFTLRNLELLEPTHPDGTALISLLDRTATPMGGRCMRRWMAVPLTELEGIEARHAAVGALLEDAALRTELRAVLGSVGDCERLTAKAATGRITPRELVHLRRGLHGAHAVAGLLEGASAFLGHLERLVPADALLRRLDAELEDEAPPAVVRGGVIRPGIHPELDALRELKSDASAALDAVCTRESARSGIPSLKVAFNAVFGYYLEVRHAHRDKVPADWIRKQTLTQAERYITPELKELETRILDAESRTIQLEQQCFDALIATVIPELEGLMENARVLAELDVLVSFAEVAETFGYVRPRMHTRHGIRIHGGRHPVIERMLPPGEPYVANDVELDPEQAQILMVTGPNMAGKSALLRSTALICLLAQTGSYVPARAADLGVLDRIFTRVGASDNLSRGESTFMVEMNETAAILNNLTDRSLVLLDEIGRGTSTYDGVSIAWAVAEFLHEHPRHRALTLFATHYHELNDMHSHFPRVVNVNVSVKEIDGRVVFLRKLEPGGSNHSFGIHVARLAGMPRKVVERADDVLKQLSGRHVDEPVAGTPVARQTGEFQLSMFTLDDPVLVGVRDVLLGLDIDVLTPVEALVKLHEIRSVLTGKK